MLQLAMPNLSDDNCVKYCLNTLLLLTSDIVINRILWFGVITCSWNCKLCRVYNIIFVINFKNVYSLLFTIAVVTTLNKYSKNAITKVINLYGFIDTPKI